MKGLVIEGVVTEKSKPKIVQTRYGPVLLAYAIINDGTGQIRLNLWRDQVDLIDVGFRVRVENAFSKEFKGSVELNVGSNGKIIVLEGMKTLN